MRPETDELIKVLRRRAGFEVVNTDDGAQLRIVGRVPPNMMSQWKAIMLRLLQNQAASTWKVDISKQYFHKGDAIYYAWRLVFRDPNITDILDAIRMTPPPVSAQMEEVPLGVPSNRNEGKVGLSDRTPLLIHKK